MIGLVRVLLGFESSMYSALAPVLPHYSHALHASKPAIGLLAASYPAGILPGSLIGAWIATRAGVRRTTLIGLLVFAAAIGGFGISGDIVALDALRAVQGLACGLIWGGGLTWVIAVAARERRGGILGSVMAAAIFGTLVGPVTGTLAVTAGTGPVFAVVGAVSLALAAWTAHHREPPSREREVGASPWILLRRPRALLGAWLILLEACAVGATGTLIPLRLARFGASSLVIGATFVLASLVSMTVSPRIGRVVDRRGSRAPLLWGLILAAALLVLVPVPSSAPGLVVVSVIAIGGPLTAYTVPAISLITEAAEQAGVAVALATMVLNLAWATGETIGSPVAASLSQATSDAVPLTGLGVIMLLTLWPVLRARLGPSGAHPAPAEPPLPPRRPERERVGAGMR